VHSIGSKGDGEYKFWQPYDIAIDTINDAQVLAVIERGNNCIKYYYLQTYQYLGRIGAGENGSWFGEINKPIVINIHDKFMIVTESNYFDEDNLIINS
jgi:hypothetical protein